MSTSTRLISEFRQALLDCGLPQTRAAQIIGLHSRTLNRILQGHAKPSIAVLDAMEELTKKLKKSGLMAV